jgi:integrase
MARPATGQVVVDARRHSPTFGLRFRAYGKRRYVTLGTAAEGWTHAKAQTELENVLADVRRGIWQPPAKEPVPEQPNDPTLHEFASQWFEANKAGWRPKTREDYSWQLTHHLLPFFKDHALSRITVSEVDRYRSAKLRESERLAKAREDWRRLLEGTRDPAKRRELRSEQPRKPLAPGTINKTITTLAQIMEVAIEYELVDRNPAKGRRRKLKAAKPAPVWLDTAAQIRALLDAATELDGEARRGRRYMARHAMLATLVYAGLRIGELCALRWRDVDLSAGRIVVHQAKTNAGLRTIDVLPVLRDVLLALKAERQPLADDYVFPSGSGSAQNPSNIRQRVLAPTVKRANERLEAAAEAPLPAGITPHKLRHTFASLLVALGTDPGAAMDQLGHSDPAFTLRVYRHAMRRDEAAKRTLQELVGVSAGPSVWAALGSSPPAEVPGAPFPDPSNHPEKRPLPGHSGGVSEGTRTPDRLDHNQELYQLSYAHQAGCKRV